MTRRVPRNRAQRTLRRPTREAYAVREVEFDSGGTPCRGRLYLPDRPDSPPAVAVAPGPGAASSFGYPAVAERLAVAGYAALLVDYRGFGASGGTPRSLVAPERHRADLEAAVGYLRGHPDVARRTAVWGHSLGGGLALDLAARDSRVDAVVAVAPLLDGRAYLRRSRPLRSLPLALAAGLRDALGARVGLGGDVRLAGDDSTALLTGPPTKRSFVDLADRESDWENRTPARSLLNLARYRPVGRLEDVTAPAAFVAGDDDGVAPADEVVDAAGTVPGSTLVRAPFDHYDPLTDRFEAATGYATTFLDDAFR